MSGPCFVLFQFQQTTLRPADQLMDRTIGDDKRERAVESHALLTRWIGERNHTITLSPFLCLGPGFTKPVRFDRLQSVRPGFGFDRYQIGPNSKFKFEFKKMKIFQKISKNTLRCDESNGVNFSQKFVYLV